MILSRRQVLTKGAALAGMGLPFTMGPAQGAETLTNFEMPPETGEHRRTFMQWPVSEDVYGEALLKRVQASIADVAKAISQFEDVVVLVGADDQKEAQARLGGGVKTWDIPTNDLWCRDSGQHL